jgi:pyruvate dehydrogenase E2 component (dihydrolipoamide acetyltransferase)
MFQFKVPDIGEGMVEAEVLAWRVAEGDVVEEDQVLVDLMTDKAEIEIPSPRAGRVHRLHAEVGDIVPVGAILIEIDDEAAGESTSPARESAVLRPVERAQPEASAIPERRELPARPGVREARAQAGQPSTSPAHHPPEMPARPHSRQLASARAARVEAVPAVRELARRLGVELQQVQGTGPGGRVMRRDVERHQAGAAPESHVAVFAAPEADAPDWERRPLRGLRRAIARRMVQARRSAAHFTYVEEVDVTRLLERAAASELDVSPLAFIAHATVRALASHETLNASIDDAREEIILKRTVHLGVAAATEKGLLAPVVRDAASLSVAELARAIEELALRAREGRLRPAELTGSTFTITSLGKLGGVMSTPIINYPEVAILGVNAIRPVPAIVDGELRERRVMNLSLSVDHRIADGIVAAEFVRDLKEILERVDFGELLGGEEA